MLSAIAGASVKRLPEAWFCRAKLHCSNSLGYWLVIMKHNAKAMKPCLPAAQQEGPSCPLEPIYGGRSGYLRQWPGQRVIAFVFNADQDKENSLILTEK